ncbi:MAG: glycosyltransferase family 39 protein [Phormidesmis sp. RL_2_1]|nr:glycosyltransferase family 39 protein [Phormidesmis sp. RL_2_1]
MTLSSAPRVSVAASKTVAKQSQKNNVWIFCGVMAVAAVLLFYHLGIRTLNDWDEAIYAQISKEIINSGDWLTLHWGFNPWFHKPPFFMWMTAAFYQLFGVNEFSARAASALSGLGIVGCTYLISQRLYGWVSAAFASVVLLTHFAFVNYARFGTTDITLTLFIYLGIYAYLQAIDGKRGPRNEHSNNPSRSKREASRPAGLLSTELLLERQSSDNYRLGRTENNGGRSHQHSEQNAWWYLFWAAAASAMMTKGVAGLILPITAFIALAVDRQLWQTLRLKSFWLGSVLALLIVLPWHAAVIFQHGQAFINQYILYHVVERSTGGIEGNDGGLNFYFLELGKNFFPWVWLLPAAFVLQVKNALMKNGPVTQAGMANDAVADGRTADGNTIGHSRILLILPLLILGGFTIAGTKLVWYIVPCYPALAIWIGYLIQTAGRGSLRQAAGGKRAWAALVSLMAVSALVCVLTPQRVVFLSPAAKSLVAFVGLAGLALAIAVLLRLVKSRWAVVLLLCGVLALSGLREIRGLYLAVNDPVPQLAKQAGQAVPADGKSSERLIVVKLSENLYVPTAMFYSNRPIYWVRDVKELDAIASGDAILAKKDIELLSPQYEIEVLSEAQKLAYAKITRR